MLRRRSPRPWESEEDSICFDAEQELNGWSLSERFPRKPGQKHVEVFDSKPLGMRYGDNEPLGEPVGSRIIALLASHVDSVDRLALLKRCLRTIEEQTMRPSRFFVSTSADASLVGVVAKTVQNSPCVDEHREQGTRALPQFEHYRRLRDVVKEREEHLENVWIFFSDDDDMWHPDRYSAFLTAVEGVRRRVQPHIQAVCSCIHLRPLSRSTHLRVIEEVRRQLNRMVIGPQAHGSEHIDLCVRFMVFDDFFAQHSARILRHMLADVRFCYFVKHYGESPRKMTVESSHCFISDQDILDPSKSNGPVKVFLPDSSENWPNWMYFYDKIGNPVISSAGIGGGLQILRPDDEWYLANLVCEAGFQVDDAEHLLAACATLRQCLDFKLFRLPRQRPIALESELWMMACNVSSSQSQAVKYLRRYCDNEDIERWLFSTLLSRCKTLRIEVYLTDFCAACGKQTRLQCSQCKEERYCSEACQWESWQKGHKRICSARGSLSSCSPLNEIMVPSPSCLIYEVVD